MKTRSSALLCVLLFAFIPAAGAVTLEELAGTYVGKRTETYENELGILRYNEIVVINAEGLVSSYIEFNGEFLLAGSGVLDLNEDGTFGDEVSMGELTLNGRHLFVKVRFSPPFFPDVVVQFQGRRSAKGSEPAFTAASADTTASGFPLWAPVD